MEMNRVLLKLSGEALAGEKSMALMKRLYMMLPDR